MKLMLAIAAATAILYACNNGTAANDNIEKQKTDTVKPAAMNTMLTDAEQQDGWQLLFDGNTTKGWHTYGGQPVGSAWKVVDGSLHLDATQKNGGDIVTDEAFENFDLKLEWKIDTCGNSGIIFYIHEDTVQYKNTWMTGPEMQVLDNNCHPDAKIIKHRAGDLYDLISCSKETVKPALEWNAVEIKALNGKLDFYLNGENVVSTTLWDEGWKKLVAGSKFAKMNGFGTYKKGHIGLQDHGNNVWFKNIKIIKL
jgi:Domain of Unknown Function (DUF1080)